MVKVITYGTFDILHYGHINLLKRAKDMGDYLIVGLSSDKFNRLKNKQCYYDYATRKYMLESIKYIDLVICEDNWKQKTNDIKDNNIDIFVMGNDWEGKFDNLNDICEVVYLDRTPNISTTEIKKYMK